MWHQEGLERIVTGEGWRGVGYVIFGNGEPECISHIYTYIHTYASSMYPTLSGDRRGVKISSYKTHCLCYGHNLPGFTCDGENSLYFLSCLEFTILFFFCFFIFLDLSSCCPPPPPPLLNLPLHSLSCRSWDGQGN